jgi:hypothetical protein
MSLFEKAREAREHADQCTDPGCHRVALALEAALHAELHPPPPPGDTEGIPDPPVSHIRIPRGGVEN